MIKLWLQRFADTVVVTGGEGEGGEAEPGGDDGQNSLRDQLLQEVRQKLDEHEQLIRNMVTEFEDTWRRDFDLSDALADIRDTTEHLDATMAGVIAYLTDDDDDDGGEEKPGEDVTVIEGDDKGEGHTSEGETPEEKDHGNKGEQTEKDREHEAEGAKKMDERRTANFLF